VHPASAVLAASFVVWLIIKIRRDSAQESKRGQLAHLIVILLAVQFTLGIADVVLLAPAWMQLLHLLGADLYWIALVKLAADTVWPAPALASVLATPVHT
jgi:cytochrome c oxidase assembly protein subunit 15